MSRRILLADDSVTIQKVIELTFMDEDFAVTAVSNGDEALARLSDVQPDLVIADVHMPGANGYEVCRRAKASRPGLPVLLLVGTFEPFDEGEARAAGADAHLKKPFDSQELLSLVQQLLERAPAAAATPAAATPAAVPPAPASAAAADGELGEAAWGTFDLEPEPAPETFAPPPPAFSPFAAPAAPAMPAAAAATPAAAGDSSSAGRSAGFDWADSARFGRVEEATFELEDTSDALGLDDSLLHDEPFDLGAQPDVQPNDRPADGPDAQADVRLDAQADAQADGQADGQADAWLGATAADILPAPADSAAAFPPAAPFETSAEERTGVPAGSAPLTAGLAEIEEHVHRAEERHELPVPAPVAPGEPSSAAFMASPIPQPISQPIALGAATVPAQLSDDEVDRIARRVVELLGDKAVRDVAWEVIPDMAELVIKDRLRELESQVE
jgi:CheY-like chemotaxis protein